MNKFNFTWKNKGSTNQNSPKLNATFFQQLTDNIDKLIDERCSNLLYENEKGLVATSSGKSFATSENVLNFLAILIIHENGGTIVNNKLEVTNVGNEISIYWYNAGRAGTFYNNTIYKVIGINRIN